MKLAGRSDDPEAQERGHFRLRLIPRGEAGFLTRLQQTRKITLGSEPTVERLEERDDDARRLVYSIVSGALPVVDYMSTMQLSAVGASRTRLDWSSTFEPAAGISEQDALKAVGRVYKGGIGALQARFGA